jgi:hypothetical protein
MYIDNKSNQRINKDESGFNEYFDRFNRREKWIALSVLFILKNEDIPKWKRYVTKLDTRDRKIALISTTDALQMAGVTPTKFADAIGLSPKQWEEIING